MTFTVMITFTLLSLFLVEYSVLIRIRVNDSLNTWLIAGSTFTLDPLRSKKIRMYNAHSIQFNVTRNIVDLLDCLSNVIIFGSFVIKRSIWKHKIYISWYVGITQGIVRSLSSFTTIRKDQSRVSTYLVC